MISFSDSMKQFRLKTIAANHGWQKWDDDLGRRRVYLNEKEIDGVVRVNEKQGKAVVVYLPLKICKRGKKIRTHVVRGVIRVEFI